jgi:hypothetical protein
MDETKDPLFWWLQHERHLLIVGYLTKKILGIVSNQIETKKVFSISHKSMLIWVQELKSPSFVD